MALVRGGSSFWPGLLITVSLLSPPINPTLTVTHLQQGFLGFLINISSFLCIKLTSPISHLFSSAVRSVLQTLLGITVFGEVVGHGRVLALVLIVSGAGLYAFVQGVGEEREKVEALDGGEIGEKVE